MTGYVILIDRTPDGGFGSRAPDLPGCIALGDTFDECVEQMGQAVAFHLEGLRADDLSIPEPTTKAVTVNAA